MKPRHYYLLSGFYLAWAVVFAMHGSVFWLVNIVGGWICYSAGRKREETNV